MAVIDYIDGPNRNIYLHADTVGVDLVPMDIYKEMRTLRANNEELRKYDLFISAHGHELKGPGKYTERYIKLLNNTRIIPYDVSQSLTVVGTIITDDGQEGIYAFDRTLLSPTTIVDINYIPPQVEIIEINTGGGGTSTWTEDEKKQIRDAVGIDGVKRIAKGGQLQKKSESPYNITIDTTTI